MKQLLALLLFLSMQWCHAQTTDEDNLQKYWKYRDQLRKRFMKIGNGTGESQPATVIIPNRQYGQEDQTTGSIIQWRDGTITLGYYWMVLATEYRLLHQNNQDVQPTLNELYYAMQSINRLDRNAEPYPQTN
jgi:hypothetical protein